MINTNRLFLVPASSAVVVLIPIVGVFVWFLIIIHWYEKNHLEIHKFFQGRNYEQHEISEDSRKELK